MSQFHEKHRSKFPHIHLKPKGHHTLHYTELMKKLGVLRNNWKFRLESKHSFFVDISRRTKNRRNLCKTMAERHQFMQTAYLSGDSYQRQCDQDTCFDKQDHVDDLINEAKCLVQPLLGPQQMVHLCQSATHAGVRYRVKLAVLVGQDSDQLQFAIILNYYMIRGRLYIPGNKQITVEYDRHYHVYITHDGDNECVLRTPRELTDHDPLPVCNLHGQYIVPLKHFVDMEWFLCIRELAPLEIMDHRQKYLDNGKILTTVGFFDSSKDFDTLHNTILIDELFYKN